MKKILIVLFALLAGVMTSSAQETVTIRLADGTSITKYVWEVEDISFGRDESPLTPAVPEAAVDLGLSVAWSPFNLGAATDTEEGYKVGWGDYTGKIQVPNLKFYPTLNPPTDIVAQKYDIARTMWGEDWRLPTTEEIQELIDGCEWTLEENGYRVTSKAEGNANSILLPFAEGVNYWSGWLSADANSSDCAQALSLSAEGKPVLADVMRSVLSCVRPVYGDYDFGVVLSIGNPKGITTDQCVFPISLNGSLFDIEEFGLCYTTNPILVANVDYGTCKKIEITPGEEQKTLSVEYTLSGFDFLTHYYCFAYALVDGIYYYSNIVDFNTKSFYHVPADEEAVDLGLGVKWAPYNMGASSDVEPGGLYGWGDATGMNTSTDNSEYGPIRNIQDIAGTDYDMAHVQWKSQWRLPSEKELKELYDNCEQEYVGNYNGTGLRGYIFTGPNGNKLFIPYNGYREGGKHEWYNTTACFWSSEIDENNNPVAVYYRGFQYMSEGATYRHRGLSIRPVFGKYNAEWKGENPGGETGGETGGGETGGGETGGGEEGDNNQPETPTAGSPVDLGLSVLWADHNVGGSKESDFGSYYAWGELEEHTGNYYREDYTYYIKGSEGSFTAIGNSYYDISGMAEYDVARAEWGGKWRMPTETEMQELIKACEVEFTYSNGVGGYKVTATNGKSIFLPCAGYKYDNTSYGVLDKCAEYWTSSMYILPQGNHAKDRDWSYHLEISEFGSGVERNYRYFGMPVRPVRDR